MIATPCHAAQLFNRVELIVAVGRSHAVKAVVLRVLVIVDRDPERIESPQQAVGSLDRRGDSLDRSGIERLPWRRRREAIQKTVLIARDNSPFVVDAEVHPRSLLLERHGIKQLDLKILRHLDPLGRRRLVFVDRLAGVGTSALGRARLRRRRRLCGGQAREAEGGEQMQEPGGNAYLHKQQRENLFNPTIGTPGRTKSFRRGCVLQEVGAMVFPKPGSVSTVKVSSSAAPAWSAQSRGQRKRTD